MKKSISWLICAFIIAADYMGKYFSKSIYSHLFIISFLKDGEKWIIKVNNQVQWRRSFSFSNEEVFSWFLRSTGAITMYNTLQLSFALFPSNRCRWFGVHPKKPHNCVYSTLRTKAGPILPRFFSHSIFRAKLKTQYFKCFSVSGFGLRRNC